MNADAAAGLGSEDFSQHGEIVSRIRSGDIESGERLYELLVGTALGRLRRGVDPQLVEDKFQDVAVTVLEAIHEGRIREPKRLIGFVSTVAQRRVSRYIRMEIVTRKRLVALEPWELPPSRQISPEMAVLQAEQFKSLRRAFLRICPRDREILARFYLGEQTAEEICASMHLSATQFRLFKSRAIARCSESMQRVHRKAISARGC